MMDRNEKGPYYCSDVKFRPSEAQEQTNSNNNNLISKFDIKDRQEEMQAATQLESQLASGSIIGNGDYPSRIMTRFNSNEQQQQQPSQSINEHNRQFIQNQLISATQQQQNNNGTNNNPSSSATQPQYLISNNNPQHLTNLNPHHFNQQHNNNSPFQNHLQSPNYHINSNHHLYQANAQQQQSQQQQLAQSRNSLFQHHKSPSMGEDGHIKLQNQVIFHDNNNKHDDLLRRQTNEQPNLSTSQSMTQGDFNQLRRKSEHLGMNSEVGLEGLNLEFEAMLMNDGQNNNNNNNNHLMQKQQQQQNSNPVQRDKLLRTLANQQMVGNDKSSSGGIIMTSVQQDANIQSIKDPIYDYNKLDDNIYEEINLQTMTRLQAEYQEDTISLHGNDTWKKKNAKKFLGASFTRWFSTRKKSSNSQNSDQEESLYEPKPVKRPILISLPERIPDNLTPEKMKRRLIVKSIADSENSYTNSLFRLIYEYRKPLLEADPPILSANKINIIFYNLDQILPLHRHFGYSLSSHVQDWDNNEMIGEVFTKVFSRSMVLEIYSGFINNFTNAMETAKRASKSKAFAQFIHERSVGNDRLGLFASMVKPVQRFPQFILFLSDLLKHTPYNHPDRMPLQRALTELESLADRLNERKRDAERHFAVKQLLKDHLNDSNAHSERFLLRQDETNLLDMDPSTNTILKSKSRKMYLLNDMLICLSLPSNRLKFAVPLSDISVVESVTPAISNLLAHSNFKNLNDNPNAPLPQNYTIERMECERQSLVHDLELMMRLATIVANLRFQYNGLNPAVPEQICMGIREEIRKKEFQMTLIDRSCLQLRLHSKNNKDVLVVQFETPDSKRDWLIDLRLTKLALDRANNPGWENVSDKPPPTHLASLYSIGQRVPLFVKSLAIFKCDQSHLTCALHYYLRQAPFIGENPAGVLWICNVSVDKSSLGALATNGSEISLIHSYELSDSHVTCLESVGSTLWIGLRQGRIIVIDANSPGEWTQFASLDVQSEVTCIKYFGHFVYVGLINGIVAVFDAINFDKPLLIQLSQSPVTCLLPINEEIFACSHNRVWRIRETNIIDSFTVQTENIILDEEPRPNLLAHHGSGIWVSLLDSAIVKLFHAESLVHLVDINVGNSIRRVLHDDKEEIKITVTSIMATRGLLWIGTNVGMIATLTLPRLQGVPLVSGSINVALHRFLGPVNIMLNLSAGSECVPQLPFNNRNTQQLKSNLTNKDEDAEAIYGQYADLMNVDDYITSGRKSGNLGENPSERMPWDQNVNISSMNISDESGSNASSGAIYQDGLPRGMKHIQNKAIISNASNLSAQNQQTLPPQTVQAQLLAGGMGQNLPSNPISDPNHVYDKAPTQSITYNQGSLNRMTQPIAQNLSDGISIERLQQRPMLSASQNQLSKMDQTNAQADYGSQSGKAPGKLYDQPTQLLQQQQQIIQQTRQAANQVDGAMLSNLQPQVSNYGSLGGKSKLFMGNKTVLVLAGGNGYQRMVEGDNKPFGEHAHCIVWEYKA